MGAGAGALAAAMHPDLVRGLVLLGPFVRNGQTSTLQRLCSGSPWHGHGQRPHGRPTCPSSTPGSGRPTSTNTRERVVASLRRPGYAKAFSLTTRTSHDPAEARLGEVSQPTLVVMGDQDPYCCRTRARVPPRPIATAPAALIRGRRDATMTRAPPSIAGSAPPPSRCRSRTLDQRTRHDAHYALAARLGTLAFSRGPHRAPRFRR
jgi:pimeloyl-ACP methyl ester carboxylesterase